MALTQEQQDYASGLDQKYGFPDGTMSTLVNVESSGNGKAASSKGAKGYAQLTPAAMKDAGYGGVDPSSLPFQTQLDIAANHLNQGVNKFGDIGMALAGYNAGNGRINAVASGKSSLPSETAGYVQKFADAGVIPNDSPAIQYAQSAKRGSSSLKAPDLSDIDRNIGQIGSGVDWNTILSGKTHNGSSGVDWDSVLAQHAESQEQPFKAHVPYTNQPTIGDDFEQAGKGLLQTGINIANIPNAIENTAAGAVRDLGNYIGGPVGQALVNDANRPGVTDTIKGGAAYIGNKIGIGDGTYQPGTGFQLPESLQPTDEYAKAGAEIGSYLVPGPGEVNAVSRAAPLVERAGNALSHMLSENVVGTLANSQQNGQIDPNQLLANTALGVVGSAGARAIPAAFNGVRNAVQGGRATRAAAAAVDDVAPVSSATDSQAAQQADPQVATPTSNAGSPTEETLRNVSNSPPKDIASSLDGLNINPDQDILNSANNLGVSDNLLPSHYSGNDQYRAVEQAIKSRKGSALQVQENQAINDLAKRSGQMIDEVAGLPDALGVSDKFNNEMTYRMKALENRSDQLYARIDNAMPPAKPVDANQTLSHLESNADQLGGWDNLDPVEQRVYKALTPTDNGVVTYANLNKQRRLIGNAIGKNAGPYKDADQAALKQLYGALSRDQLTALGDTGAARDFQVANRLVQMRKTLEDNSIALRSKTLTGDVTYSASTALKAMQSGNGKPFRDLMDNIPSRKMRSEILATGIRDMLSNGKRGSDFNPGGYADWWQNLKATGQLKLLSQHLPKEFMSGLADVYNVARGIQRANKDHISTGALVEFTNRFNRVTQSHEMAAKYAQRVGLVVGAKAGPFGSLVGDSIGAKIAAKARQKGGAGSADAAEKLISSPEFQAAAKKAQASKSQPLNQKAADLDTAARKNKGWHAFYSSLPDVDKKIIARIGIVGWLSANDDN
ncbi:lytic transglycosylase domain-containing protein [Rosenbergiella nectarea]|uniref:lytic transglycosylase domain-containing protein n=1 Tax=Rosenbergiella nectarea TaxID=988801 RepID=UPI001BDA84CB|nr:lytic transglycosylase domain-containing protein [Rosenbergiella nectarea]MBT0731017.1 lytic transglycosylase domain-containing protein [Rosenbergiella nectarea subsp. apis]